MIVGEVAVYIFYDFESVEACFVPYCLRPAPAGVGWLDGGDAGWKKSGRDFCALQHALSQQQSEQAQDCIVCG